MTIGQDVHCFFRRDKLAIPLVNSQEGNAVVKIKQLPARATIGGIPALDGGGPTDVWEVGKRTQRLVSSRPKAI